MNQIIGLSGQKLKSGKELRTRKQQEEIDEIKRQLAERDGLINQIGFMTSIIYLLIKDRTDKENKHHIPNKDVQSIPPDVGVAFSIDPNRKTTVCEIVKIN